jgi:hypothetical protein
MVHSRHWSCCGRHAITKAGEWGQLWSPQIMSTLLLRLLRLPIHVLHASTVHGLAGVLVL